MERKNFLIGLLTGVCFTLALLIVMGFDEKHSAQHFPMDRDGKIVVKLSDEDLKKISKSVVDDEYIIKRILYCIDGSTISDGKISTFCNR